MVVNSALNEEGHRAVQDLMSLPDCERDDVVT